MQEIAVLLDEEPELALEMVQLDIRNKQAHSELQAYNEHRVFVYKHPLTIRQKNYNEQLSELYNLKQNNPDALITEITNVTQNIRRIQSNLKNKKYKTDEEKEAWENNLSRAEMRKKILSEVVAK